ncbi:hypothetical protein L202_01839 [Cryptococcus amylolentus CBS 6039]|uniref:Uncharacterized protein n=1 Tax=Cryptococcus amylolentus CBS 6039 TaxID=1295533 RepID=A0A1E3I5F9_9TREE|nr:hypothetical protein L202_01839 [Cryptococcus amylolentus CBS 6039]ODN83747.1 hypothetical protein L202_01839 [Cryptococcus amylolentus CBS 6039]
MSARRAATPSPMPLPLPTPPVDAAVQDLEQGLVPSLHQNPPIQNSDITDVLGRPIRRESLNACADRTGGVRESERVKPGFTIMSITTVSEPSAVELASTRPAPAFFPTPAAPTSDSSMHSSLSSATTETTLASTATAYDVDPKRSPLEVFTNAHFHSSADIELGVQRYNKVAPSGIKEKRENCMKAPRWIAYAAASLFLVSIIGGCTYALVHHVKREQDVKG